MKFLRLVLLSNLLIVSIANAKVLNIAETGFIIENTITVNKTSKQAWQSFVQDVDKWWPADHTWWGEPSTLSIDNFAGGCFCEKLEKKSAEHMRIVFVDPEKLMRMTGGLGPLQGMGMYGALEWSFSTEGSNTKITMTYRVNGINPDGYSKLAPIVDHVQGLQLNALKAHLSK